MKSATEPCVCSQLRRAARMVSLFYDASLLSTGISVTQYALLANIARTDGLSHTALAARLGMERTTLTRNLKPLERAGLVTSGKGEDRRQRLLRLTVSGHQLAVDAQPRWMQAQQRMLKHLGKARWQQLRQLLQLTEQILK